MGSTSLPGEGAAGWASSGGAVGGGWTGVRRSGRGFENGAAGIMIRLWDLTTAANRCQESMNVMYGELYVEGGDGERA